MLCELTSGLYMFVYVYESPGTHLHQRLYKLLQKIGNGLN